MKPIKYVTYQIVYNGVEVNTYTTLSGMKKAYRKMKKDGIKHAEMWVISTTANPILDD